MNLLFDFVNVNVNDLIDLPLQGRKFTWSNNRDRVAMSRNVGLIDFYYLRSGMITWRNYSVGSP